MLNEGERVKHLISFLLLLPIVLLIGCDKPASEYKRSLFVFGTLVDISIVDASLNESDMAVKAIDEQFQKMHTHWHAWKPGGELATFNSKIAKGETVEVSDFLLPLIIQSVLLSEQSEHLFNPAIGELINLWGFHSDELPEGPPPGKDTIQNYLITQPFMSDLKINGHLIRATNAHVQLDLGGFAKGYALNEATRILQEEGVRNAIVNAGGDLCVIGEKGNRPWRIGIRHPQGEGVIASVEARDGECVLTSGNYERYRVYEGKRYPHILDPGTGMPVNHIASVTVIDRDGGRADAAATALTIAGPEHWYRIARKMQLEYVMLVDAQGNIYMNPAMQRRLHLETGQSGTLIVSAPL